MENIIKITIKHFNTKDECKEANEYKIRNGLQEFNSLSFQYNRIPVGEYEIDTTHIFSNQYNTIGENGRPGYRIFEYSEPLADITIKPLGYGYYISSGIDKIRELQKKIKVCGYCGKQYKNTKKQFCFACVGSKHLTKENYPLLRLVELLAKDKFNYKNVIVPIWLEDKIKKAQYKTQLKELKKIKKDKLESIKKDIQSSKKELTAFKWLINNGIDFKNVIHYSHTDKFCFGWRNSLDESQKTELMNKLKEFPFNYEFKTQ